MNQPEMQLASDGAITKSSTDRFAEVDGITLHFNEAGSGPALICTHGGGPGANAWDNAKAVLPLLARHFRTLLVDCPGYGESQKGVSRNGVPMDIFVARLLLGLMNQLGIDRAHMYGSSQFGPAALRFGLAYPDRVGKIVIQSSDVGSPEGEPPEGIKSLGRFAENPTYENMERIFSHFTPRPEFRSDEVIQDRFKKALAPGHLESRREMTNASNSPLVEELRDLRTEVLITCGNEDGMVLVQSALHLLQVVPNSRAVIWGDHSGHFVIAEHGPEFARIVTDFLLN